MQTAITHFSPLCVLCSCIQSWLIRELLAGRRPLETPDWLAKFWTVWDDFHTGTLDIVMSRWSKGVGKPAIADARDIVEAAFATDDFDPFKADFTGRAGYVVLTLQIAIWGLKWSFRDDPFPVPAGWPPEVFSRRGGDVIGWIPLIGNDADSYGAATAPILWAAHRKLPASLVAELKLLV